MSIFSWKEEKWIALQNIDNWGKQYLMNEDILDYKPKKKYCENNSLVCNDYSFVENYKLNTNVKRQGENGNYSFSFSPQPEKSILIISSMYRQEWTASSQKKTLNVFPVFDGFIGIQVPENIEQINLKIENNMRNILMLFSFLVFLFCIAGSLSEYLKK